MKRSVLKEIKRCFALGGVNDIVKELCGDKIGAGVYRDVFFLKADQGYVVKVERDMSRAMFANVTEFRNYVNNKDWDLLRDWMAPCEGINQTGQILIEERVYWDGKKCKDYPTHIPDMLTDIKRSNFGWLKNGNFVCCDYSFMVLATKGKMKYAKWRGSINNK